MEQHGIGPSNAKAARGGPHHGKSWSNILVAVRCRKLLDSEQRCGGRQCVEVVEGKLVVLQDPQTTAADDYLRIGKSKEKRYVFDHAFGELDDTEGIYQATTSGLIDGVLRGYNATVFAYGGTGAGKTHTMIGYANDGARHGIMGLILQDLFAQVKQHAENKTFDVRCSFLEVYNENIRDLLSPKKEEYLDLREDPFKGMTVAGIEEVSKLSSADEIMHLLKRANRNRTSEPTAANQTSSRSHAVMCVTVEQQDRTAGIHKLLEIGKFSVIDLAGSERASQTANRGIRMLEGANINRSLLALGNCITALADNMGFVPYRDSKLTRLLKDSLGGNCRTVMIANVSPCHLNYEDTHNTLKYANRAKAIRTKVTRNVQRYTHHVAQYTSIIQELRSEISNLKTNISASTSSSLAIDSVAGGGTMGSEGAANFGGVALQLTEAVQTWEQRVCQNIEERVQIKRSLLDLKHSEAKCLMAKSRLQVAISSWEQQHGQSTYVGSTIAEEGPGEGEGKEDQAPSGQLVVGEKEDGLAGQGPPSARREEGPLKVVDLDMLPSSIRDWRKQLQGLMTQMEKQVEIRADLEDRLRDNEEQMQLLEQKLPEMSGELRQFFTLMCKIQVMEVENMELEEVNNMTDLIIQQKDLEGEKLRLQIAIRDQMIAEQSEMVKWKASSEERGAANENSGGGGSRSSSLVVSSSLQVDEGGLIGSTTGAEALTADPSDPIADHDTGPRHQSPHTKGGEASATGGATGELQGNADQSGVLVTSANRWQSPGRQGLHLQAEILQPDAVEKGKAISNGGIAGQGKRRPSFSSEQAGGSSSSGAVAWKELAEMRKPEGWQELPHPVLSRGGIFAASRGVAAPAAEGLAAGAEQGPLLLGGSSRYEQSSSSPRTNRKRSSSSRNTNESLNPTGSSIATGNIGSMPGASTSSTSGVVAPAAGSEAKHLRSGISESKQASLLQFQRKRHYLPYIDAMASTAKKRKAPRSNMLLRAISDHRGGARGMMPRDSEKKTEAAAAKMSE